MDPASNPLEAAGPTGHLGYTPLNCLSEAPASCLSYPPVPSSWRRQARLYLGLFGSSGRMGYTCQSLISSNLPNCAGLPENTSYPDDRTQSCGPWRGTRVVIVREPSPHQQAEDCWLGAMCYRFCSTVTNSLSRSRSTSAACQRAFISAACACQPFCSGESENLGPEWRAEGKGHVKFKDIHILIQWQEGLGNSEVLRWPEGRKTQPPCLGLSIRMWLLGPGTLPESSGFPWLMVPELFSVWPEVSQVLPGRHSPVIGHLAL